ncbi:uncharacterized protein FA14DRAFT_162430 [Meira miltonrushii]|uniref:Uncharacterized protein n=1 Tax=Meira miltonrushii TaxID=1280837 RepID=A0A316V3V3_9BASI|nr:uncharacterized protein FA14DRAFT_162430 [Meira miltonrushii]PWN32237.1 hypothetical protein FA14DRAFT_162430 [Meira miltonrushii]
MIQSRLITLVYLLQLVVLTQCCCIPKLGIGRNDKPERKSKLYNATKQQELLKTETAKQQKFQSQANDLRKTSKNPFSNERKMARKFSKNAKISENNIKEIKKLPQTGGYAIVQKTKSGSNAKIKAWQDPT